MATIRYRIVHTTEYRFSQTAASCELVAILCPRETARQRVDHFQIVTRPLIELKSNKRDDFGNHLSFIDVSSELQRLLVSANSMVTVTTVSLKTGPQSYRYNSKSFLQSTELVPLGARIVTFGGSLIGDSSRPLDAAQKITRRIHEDFAYHPGSTDITTSAAQVLELRRGVCQDFAHLAIAVLRAKGMPARYVSGYVHTAAFRGKDHRIAADASHAWFEVYDARYGWVGFDPTNGRRVDEHYIVVALGRDYNDVCPLRGTFKGGGATFLSVSVDVHRIE